MKISQATFEGICDILGEKVFHIHTNAEDSLMRISNENSFIDARKELMDEFGDVEISIHPDAHYWSEKVQIEDKKWEKAYEAFCKTKAAWCAKYGCD